MSAAIVWTVGLALLADTVGHETIGQAVGYVSISMSVAILIGPLLGGVVYAKAGYFSVYYMAFGMIILDIILRLLLVEKKVAVKWAGKTPHPRSQATTSRMPNKSIPALSEGVPPAPSSMVHTTPIQAPATAAITPYPSPSNTPTNRETPLPAVLTLLTSRRLLAALFCTLAQSCLMTSPDAVLPLYTHRLFGWTSIGAGLIFLPLIIPSFLAPLIGYWADKRKPSSRFLFTINSPFVCIRPSRHLSRPPSSSSSSI